MSHPRDANADAALITYASTNYVHALSMPSTAIAQVHCIAIEGTDARRFAQAQFSGDVHALSPGHWQWNAWLDAQGRVNALMHLVTIDDDQLLMVLRGGDPERVRAGLARYLLRTRATLAPRASGGYADGALTNGRVETDGQDLIIGYGTRSLRLGRTVADPDPAASNAWRLVDIRSGWPTLPQGEACLFPPALGLERLGAMSYDKGCYPGQEIAARLHYRGGHKLRLFHLRGLAPAPSGAVREAGDAGTVQVLDTAFTRGTVEMLVVAREDMDIFINSLDNKYDVVSRFDP